MLVVSYFSFCNISHNIRKAPKDIRNSWRQTTYLLVIDLIYFSTPNHYQFDFLYCFSGYKCLSPPEKYEKSVKHNIKVHHKNFYKTKKRTYYKKKWMYDLWEKKIKSYVVFIDKGKIKKKNKAKMDIHWPSVPHQPLFLWLCRATFLSYNFLCTHWSLFFFFYSMFCIFFWLGINYRAICMLLFFRFLMFLFCHSFKTLISIHIILCSWANKQCNDIRD